MKSLHKIQTKVLVHRGVKTAHVVYIFYLANSSYSIQICIHYVSKKHSLQYVFFLFNADTLFLPILKIPESNFLLLRSVTFVERKRRSYINPPLHVTFEKLLKQKPEYIHSSSFTNNELDIGIFANISMTSLSLAFATNSLKNIQYLYFMKKI